MQTMPSRSTYSYKALLDNLLLTIDVPYDCITCTDMQCTDVNPCAFIPT